MRQILKQLFTRRNHGNYRKKFNFSKRDYREMRRMHMLFSSQGLTVRDQYRIVKIIMSVCIPLSMLLTMWNIAPILLLSITVMVCLGLFVLDYTSRHGLSRKLAFVPAISIMLGLAMGFFLLKPAVAVTLHQFGGPI
jgi:hypothetical protein